MRKPSKKDKCKRFEFNMKQSHYFSVSSYRHGDGKVQTCFFINQIIGRRKTPDCPVSLTEKTSMWLSHWINTERVHDAQSGFCCPYKCIRQDLNNTVTAAVLNIILWDEMSTLPPLLFVASSFSKQTVKVTMCKCSPVLNTQSIFSVLITSGWNDMWALTLKTGLDLKDRK